MGFFLVVNSNANHVEPSWRNLGGNLVFVFALSSCYYQIIT